MSQLERANERRPKDNIWITLRTSQFGISRDGIRRFQWAMRVCGAKNQIYFAFEYPGGLCANVVRARLLFRLFALAPKFWSYSLAIRLT